MFKRNWIAGFLLLTGCMAVRIPLKAQNGVPAQTVVTITSKKGAEAPAATPQELKITLDGKSSAATSFVPLRGEKAALQIVVLIDNSARAGLSLQFADLKNFIQKLPEGAEVGVSYMQNGRAVTQQNITADRNLAAEALRIPSGTIGDNGSPYFCLSDLVKNWPSADTPSRNNPLRREVLMITDGVDLYYGRGYDPNDPYVQAAIADAQKAGVLVYSIFYRDSGRFDNSQWTQAGAQSYLLEVSQGTGGHAYWQGFGNPVSFVPFLDDLNTRLQNQYELGLIAHPKNKAELQPLKVKTTVSGVNVDAPQKVLVPGSESASITPR
jgi:hypothetical protein